MSGVALNIIEDCIKGNRKAQNTLYSQYCDAMYNICLRMLKNQTDAEDVLQQSFFDVFRKLDQYRMEASIGSWIKKIVINKCLDFLKKRNFIEEWNDQLNEISDDTNVTTEEPIYTVESIKKAMQQLSDGYRVCLNLYLFEGLDHVEISEYLGISVSTSKTQYHRAKKRLLEIMNTQIN